MERAYTVAEIDALRRVVETKWLFGYYARPTPAQVPDRNYSSSGQCVSYAEMSRSYNERDKEVAVEQRVRTHMLAGHTAADLIESEKAPA